MGRRPGRTAAKNAAAALKNTPQAYDDPEDDPTIDAPPSDAGTIPENDEDDIGEEEPIDSEAEEEEVHATPVPDTTIRKKRLGRPPKIKPPGWDLDDGTTSEAATPSRGRGRGRGFRGGGRWARRGGPSHITQQPVDKEGNMMDVVNDEVELPEDAEGEKKVDKLGYLQGNREYRCRTFTVQGRGKRLYMLSTEPARCVGFRDSYLFFTKHKRLFKIIIDEDEKRDMIERELIPHSYKGRAIGVVTARSVFREFGALIIVGGKRITDDYEVARTRQEGIVEGSLADPDDAIKAGEAYNKNQYVAWFGASSVYHSGQPTVPQQTGKMVDGKKRKIMVNDVNWMLEHAREASRFNSAIAAARRQNLNGIYDPHTNIMQYPRTMQPTHARWEQINDNEPQPESADSTLFPPVKPFFSRNLLIVDTYMESSPSTHYGVPGPDGAGWDLGAGGNGNGIGDNDMGMGMDGLCGVSEDILDALPEDCRKAFEEAREREREWKGRWGSESVDGGRRSVKVDKGLIL
ncbi:putative Chromatin structure-remodeling complex subunit rsc7 [Sclerotinia borealis F-4128]|uniref:Putative Chromatin structure-remodeling complex subunit rsc7 n=1 Tax=Sclerotinia borealis (strain F-4128) TaxID=1432307 RepID=W9C392_SCLBF|nr:putative Chromatin structure-remodeling complex subunit rsc7 [Sclerotinia borealis F-4128]